MIEKAKTILLILLVGSSLLQSYLLTYHSTDYESILENEYVDAEIIGTQLNEKALVFPQQVILHENAENHTVLYPEHYFYRLILGELKSVAFEGLRVSNKSTILLRQMMNEQRGVEIRFSSNLPIQILRNAIPFDIGLRSDTEWIRTIWITETEGDTEVYLIGQDFTEAYEVLRTDLSGEKVREYVRFGAYQSPNYIVSNFGYLYPAEPIPMFRTTYGLTSLTSDKMENMLFPDPGITRNWATSEGLEIYSDGKRGLEIDSRSLWMSFTDPLAPIDDVFTPAEDLSTAIQFVNEHGGWNGKYELERVELGASRSEPEFIFRQFIPSYPSVYPVLNGPSNRFGQIGVVLERDVVTEYKRSLIIVDETSITRTETFLPGGDVLKQRLDNLGLSLQIAAVTPAFKSKITPETIEFIPVWAVYLNDGTLLELP